MYARERRKRVLPLSSHVWLPRDLHCLHLSYFLASKAKAKCQVMKIIVHYNGSTLFWVSLLQILLWRLLGRHYFYVAHDTPHDLPAKFLHNHCFQFRYVIAVFSEKAKTMPMLFFRWWSGEGGRGWEGGRGGGLARFVKVANIICQIQGFNLINPFDESLICGGINKPLANSVNELISRHHCAHLRHCIFQTRLLSSLWW